MYRLTQIRLGVVPRRMSTVARSEGPTASPFSNVTVHRSIGEAGKTEALELTIPNIDEALNDVRPYLLADGGDVEVVSFENGVVSVRLQGTCSSCAASDATLQMGIKRALQAKFGAENVKEVRQILDESCGMPKKTTAEAVDMHLMMLRGALNAYGGSVEVVKVEPPRAELKYVGPEGIGTGLKAAVKAQFKDINIVEFV